MASETCIFMCVCLCVAGSLRGLLGNYNGNSADDLLPRYGAPLPGNATMREIHFKFGLTCKLA